MALYDPQEFGRSGAEAPSGLRPFGVEPAARSQAEPLVPNADDLRERFLAFCRSKPADEEYNFWSFGHCACAQYAKSAGMLKSDETIGASDDAIKLHDLIGGTLVVRPWTFGALAERLST